MVALIVPLHLLMMMAVNRDEPSAEMHLLLILLTAGLMPAFLATFAATTVAGSNPWARDYYGLPPFNGVRPLSTASLVSSKLLMAAMSALASWAIVLIAAPIVLVATGNHEVLGDLWKQLQQQSPTWKLMVVTALIIVGLIILTWKHLVENICVGLTGNGRIITSAIVAESAFFTALGLTIAWFVRHPDQLHWAQRLAWVAVGLKLLATCAAVVALRRRDLIIVRVLSKFMVAWLVVACVATVGLRWLIPASMVATEWLLFTVVLSLPLARLLAAPVALAYNRHR